MNKKLFLRRVLAFMLSIILVAMPLANIYAADVTKSEMKCESKMNEETGRNAGFVVKALRLFLQLMMSGMALLMVILLL